MQCPLLPSPPPFPLPTIAPTASGYSWQGGGEGGEGSNIIIAFPSSISPLQRIKGRTRQDLVLISGRPHSEIPIAKSRRGRRLPFVPFWPYFVFLALLPLGADVAERRRGGRRQKDRKRSWKRRTFVRVPSIDLESFRERRERGEGTCLGGQLVIASPPPPPPSFTGLTVHPSIHSLFLQWHYNLCRIRRSLRGCWKQ